MITREPFTMFTPIPTPPPLPQIYGFPVPTIYSLFQACMIIIGMYVVSKFFWMAYYQAKYGGDMGDRYIRGEISKEEKKMLKRRFKK